MKKRWIALFIAVVTCLAFALTGCESGKNEGKLQVVLKVDGVYYETVSVDVFNNAVIIEPTKDGYTFKGWSKKENWTEADGESYILPYGGLIRYNDVKDCVVGNNQSVTLYAAFVPIHYADLTVAWYKNASNSGLDQTIMDGFSQALNAYLTTQGYTPSNMDIVIRGYDGNVGTTCADILKDGDVDLMVGWSSTSNLTGTGGLVEGTDFLQNVGGITLTGASKARYVARLTSTDLSKLIFVWIQTEYGSSEVIQPVDPTEPGEPTEPTEPTEPIVKDRLTIAWYNLPSTSGLNDIIIYNFTKSLKAYLTSQSYDLSAIELELRAYDGSVADSCGKIKTDGNVDIMLGWGKNIGTTGGMTKDTDYVEHVDGITMGEKSRYVTRITDTTLVNLVFDWLQTNDGKAALAPNIETEIVIGWWTSSKSGLSETIVNEVVDGIKTYLTSKGLDVTKITFTVKSFDNAKVADLVTAITTDGTVDVMFGMKAADGLNEKEVINDVAMGDKTDRQTDRRIHRLSDELLTSFVFEWLKTTEAQALFVAA